MNATLPYRANAELLEAKYLDWKQDARSVEPAWASFFEGFELGMAQKAALVRRRAAPTKASPLREDARLPHQGHECHPRLPPHRSHRGVARSAQHGPAGAAPPAPRPASASPRRSSSRRSRPSSTRRAAPSSCASCSTNCAAPTATRSASSSCTSITRRVRHWLRERIEAHGGRPAPSPERQTQRPALGAGGRRRSSISSASATSARNAFPSKAASARWSRSDASSKPARRIGVQEIEMGMSHRGRLNVLANFVRKAAQGPASTSSPRTTCPTWSRATAM